MFITFEHILTINYLQEYVYKEFKDTLQTYKGKDSRFYESGQCLFKQQIPLLEGNYIYSLKVLPGFGVLYNDTIRICMIKYFLYFET